MSAIDEIAAYLTYLKTGGNCIDQIIFDELPNGEEMTATDELRRLLDENEKLQELVWELFHCSRQVGCDCCETIYRRNCGVLDRIRELGIEVD